MAGEKVRLRIRRASIGVFSCPVVLYVGGLDGFVDEMERSYGTDVSDVVSASSGGCHLQLDGGEVGMVEVAWIRELGDDPSSMQSLMHECIHVAVESMKARNVPVVPEGNSEMLAYLASSVFHDLLCATEEETDGED